MDMLSNRLKDILTKCLTSLILTSSLTSSRDIPVEITFNYIFRIKWRYPEKYTWGLPCLGHKTKEEKSKYPEL
jgi:hypothetical protein